MKLISACLLGIKCKWDGKDNHRSAKAIELLKLETLIPVCPEQLGGLKKLSENFKNGTFPKLANFLPKARILSFWTASKDPQGTSGNSGRHWRGCP